MSRCSARVLSGVVEVPSRSRMRIHVGLILAEAICIPAFVIEISRAIGGNALSWAYVFEWPIFGGYAIYMWRQLLLQDHEDPSPTSVSSDEPSSDAKLEEWNEYLQRVHHDDPRSAKPPSSS